MKRSENVFYWLPCPVVFVCSAHANRRDIMTATAMFVSEKEPLLTISTAENHLSTQLIDQSGKFTLTIAGQDQKQLAMQVGSVKGDVEDKFEKFSIYTRSDPAGAALVPEGAAAWMACTVESSEKISGYRIFIGRVVEQEDTGKPPLVWHQNAFFDLTPA